MPDLLDTHYEQVRDRLRELRRQIPEAEQLQSAAAGGAPDGKAGDEGSSAGAEPD